MEVGIWFKKQIAAKVCKVFCFVLFCFLASQEGNLMKYIFSIKSPIIAISATHYHRGDNKHVNGSQLAKMKKSIPDMSLS